MRYLFFIFLALASSIGGTAAEYIVSGTVSDGNNGERLGFATIRLQPGNHAALTDNNGRYAIKVKRTGEYTITASFIGYKPGSRKISVNSDMEANLSLARQSNTLQEVTITAKESTGLTSSSRIDRNAMSHLQPTSFSDLLELLPGNISQTPNMGSVNSIKLRETGTLGATGDKTSNPDYDITSLGTLFVVDGAPINGDANLQYVPSTTDQTSPEFKKNTTNKGVDMRSISTDNIESVEVVRGIPSAEYGNLTSGMVNIHRIKRATPLTARLKVDEYSKMISVGKGFYVSKSGNVMNIDGGYLDSKVDPRNSLENYKRVNLSARLNARFDNASLLTTWTPGADYTGSFDNTKTDPDLSYSKINEYKSSYNRTALTSDLTFTFKKLNWMKRVNINTSASYQDDRLERHKQVAPQRASVAPTTMDAGDHDGQYLLTEYIADYVSEGKPLNLFAKIKADGSLTARNITNSYKIGSEWSLSKNYGRGQIYNLTQPLSASWTTRPRAYKDIPSLQVLSFYIEDNITAQLGMNRLEMQGGVRTIQMLNLDPCYTLHGKVYADPRINAVWHFPEFKMSGHGVRLLLAGGYGLTTKMPTIDYLYPQLHYNDIVQLNYYDVNKPTEYSRVNLRTYIEDVTNYDIRPARNHKWEVRLGAEFAGNRLSVTYFRENMSSGYRYSTYYAPYAYRKYDASSINPATLTGQPSLESLSYTDEKVLDGYKKAANGSRLDKEGVEFQFNSARFRPIATALTITGGLV